MPGRVFTSLLFAFTTFASLTIVAGQTIPAKPAPLANVFAKLPLIFEQNRGQTDRRVKFLARGPGYTMFVTAGEMVFSLKQTEMPAADLSRAPITHGAVVRMKFAGKGAQSVTGESALPGKSNYFFGGTVKSIVNAQQYARVRMHQLYEGIDAIYYGNEKHLEYDLVVAPGADPNQIRFSVEGAHRIRLDSNGDLVLETAMGELRHEKPHAYQTRAGQRDVIGARYVLRAGNEIGIALNHYDRSQAVIVDPVLRYSTYLGGTRGYDGFAQQQFLSHGGAFAVAVDSSGNTYVTGYTDAVDFPTTAGAFDRTGGAGCNPHGCNSVAYVTKINPSGSNLVYSTYLGGPTIDDGSGATIGEGIAVDSSGHAFVAGLMFNEFFPTTANAFQQLHSVCSATSCAFLTRLNTTGSALLYSTLLGGDSGDTVAFALAIDSNRRAYLTGKTNAPDFPTSASAFQKTAHAFSYGVNDAFVSKIDPALSGKASLVYSTFLGGSADDQGRGIAVDSSGNAYATGITASADFPRTAQFANGTNKSFVTKLNSTGSGMVYSALLANARTAGIALDSSRQAYVTGSSSGSMRVTGHVFQSTNHGTDAFATKLSAVGNSLPYSTYFGGSGMDRGNSIAVDTSGHAFITGVSGSLDFPITATLGFGNVHTGVFVANLKPDGSGIEYYSVAFGGTANSLDGPHGIVLDRARNAYIAGETHSSFPTTSGAYQTSRPGSSAGFIAKLMIVADLAAFNAAPSSVKRGANFTYTISADNKGPDRADNLVVTDAVPSGTTFVSVVTTSGSCSAPPVGGTGTVTCKFSPVPAGGSWVAQLTVKAVASAGTTITNTVKATASTQDLNKSNNSSTARTVVQ